MIFILKIVLDSIWNSREKVKKSDNNELYEMVQ